MIISGGKVIAIDKVKHDDTLTGDGRFEPLGINKDILTTQVYFSGTLGSNNSNGYFSITNNTLSASPYVKYFNLCVNYDVITTNACPDFIYESNVSFNNINNYNYTDGYKPKESVSYSYNILNDTTNSYNFSVNKDSKLNISNVKISCIGFLTSGTPVPPEPVETINVLGDNSEAISFGDILVRV